MTQTRRPRAGGVVPVIIAGGGPAGLTLALTLHQIGVPFQVFEAQRRLRPMGVGLNLQPNAVRELAELGLRSDALDRIGTQLRDWVLLDEHGREVHAERRGLEAGYRWAQYAVHRGAFHMLLAETLVARAGADVLQTGHRLTGYRNEADGTVTVSLVRADARVVERRARLLIACDGLHSEVRAQMYPDQPDLHWGGGLMWRGVTRALPPRAHAFVGLGTPERRVIVYPISRPDPETGLVDLNWLAERTVGSTEGWQRSGWYKPVAVASFAHHFEGLGAAGLDVSALLAGTDTAYESPMIDRDPVPGWVDGRVALMGDAAHPMFPTGSNGASQAVIDARTLGAALLEHGLTEDALHAYDGALREAASALVLRNRDAGPFGLLSLLEARGGAAADIETALPATERAAFMDAQKAAAGCDRARVNAAASIIPPRARVGAG